MARVHFVKKARKAIPSHGIEKGMSYYWWQFFRQRTRHVSKNYPRRSLTTQSEFYATIWDAEDTVTDTLAELQNGMASFEDLASACDDAAMTVRDLGEDCSSKHDNMPDGLQEGDTGQLLQSRSEACETLAEELENVASEIRDLDPGEPEEKPEPTSPEAKRLLSLVAKAHEIGTCKTAQDVGFAVARTNWAESKGLNCEAILKLFEKHKIDVTPPSDNEEFIDEAVSKIEGISWDCE